MKRKLDRRVQFDERSKNFAIRALLLPSVKPRSYTWLCPVWLDQGEEGACVGFSVCQEAAAKPVEVKGITNAKAMEVYNRARQLDEWEGEDYDGTSVIAGIKAGRELGWYPEFRWAFGLDDLVLAIGHHGPAVLGINWYENMFEPNERGLVTATGELAGGHAIVANGVNIKSKLIRLHNSWGHDWGINGDCVVSFDDVARLLDEDGEACIPVKRASGPAS